MQIVYPGRKLTSRAWADIYLDRLADNYRSLRQALPNQLFMGMVKANAYGHGAIEVSRCLESLGAEYLAVTCLDEAMELRLAGISLPILILGYVEPSFAPLLASRISSLPSTTPGLPRTFPRPWRVPGGSFAAT